MRNIADQRAVLESTNEVVEAEVRDRTADLAASRRELLKSDNAIRAIVETAVDGIISIDFAGTIQSANPAAEQMFGYPQGEMIGRNVNMLMPAPYADEHDGYLEAYLEYRNCKGDWHWARSAGETA